MPEKFHKDVSDEETIWVEEGEGIREIDVGNVDVYSVPVIDIYTEKPEDVE